MAGNSKDSKILAYKDMINQLNKTISAQTELLQGQLLYFQLISGPAEPALDFHAFIQQHKSVRLMSGLEIEQPKALKPTQ